MGGGAAPVGIADALRMFSGPTAIDGAGSTGPPTPTEVLMSTEAWLRGPIDGIPPLLMPVAHALVQARDELEVARSLTSTELWARPGGAASIGFHLRHIPGAIDRLLTYADGRLLDADQMAALRAEAEVSDPHPTADELLGRVSRGIDQVLAVLTATDEASLLEPRGVGRAQLPTNVLGLLFHIAEHTQRHVGQVVTTAKVVRGA